jgi:zinc transporter 2
MGKEDSVRAEARRRLVLACVICLLFMCVEIVGGYLSGSLAILTDAAHLLSDLAGFLISLFALWLAGFPPSHHMSFGYQRAEIIGATLSVFLIWLLTGVLVWEAVQRMLAPEPLDGKIMFITATLGLLANLVYVGCSRPTRIMYGCPRSSPRPV